MTVATSITMDASEPAPRPGSDSDAGAAVAWVPTRDLATLRGVVTYTLGQLAAKRKLIDLWWRYYDGDHPQLWMTEKLRQVFGPQFEGSLQDNYCGLAVEAAVLRLEVTGWTLPDADDDQPEGPAQGDPPQPPTPPAADAPAQVTSADRVQALWDANGLDLEQEELYRAARVAGEAFVIAWPRYDDQNNQVRDQDTDTPLFDIAVNDARNVHVECGANRSQRLWACKVWLDTTASGGPSWRANVYYGDELVRLRTEPVRKPGSNAAVTLPAKADKFTLDDLDPGGPNPMGTVPVFRFARDRRGRSVLQNLVPIQDKINKLGANKMVAAEFLAWRQRWILTTQQIPDDKLRPAPGSVLQLDPGGETEDGDSPPTRVGEFAATELGNYDNAQAAEVVKFFTIGQLPRHLIVDPGTPPSGDSIKADEGPFISTVLDSQQMYGGTWADLWRALGYDVEPAWTDPRTENLESAARTVLTLNQAGCPVDLAIRVVLGWDEELLEELRGEVKAQADAAKAAADAANAMAMRALDAGMTPGGAGNAELGE